MKTHRSGGIPPQFLTLTLNVGKCSVSRPRPLYHQGKGPWNPLNRLHGPQRQSGHCGLLKFTCPCHESNPGHLARSPPIYWPYSESWEPQMANVKWTPSLHAEPWEHTAGRGNTALADVNGYEIVLSVVCTHWCIKCRSSWDKTWKFWQRQIHSSTSLPNKG
jgi:hypothetical protein